MTDLLCFLSCATSWTAALQVRKRQSPLQRWSCYRRKERREAVKRGGRTEREFCFYRRERSWRITSRRLWSHRATGWETQRDAKNSAGCCLTLGCNCRQSIPFIAPLCLELSIWQENSQTLMTVQKLDEDAIYRNLCIFKDKSILDTRHELIDVITLAWEAYTYS